ncbi:MAG: DUF3047 domain-containing protein [Nitrospirota bacterium]
MSWNVLRRRYECLALLLIAGLLAVAAPSRAESDSQLVVGAFSQAPQGPAAPPGWSPLTFKKVPVATQYAVVRDEGTTVVRAVSQAGASGLIREIAIDLKTYPVIEWRWKVSNLIAKGDVTKKEGDDYPARIYITFAYDPQKVGFSKRAKYRAARLLVGDLPIGAITYIWDGRTPRGTVVDNAYTDFVKMIVIESGDEHVNQWMIEERNVYDDYRRAFGEEPPLVNGVAIMTDSDNTQESATAYYGDIVFKPAR